MFLSIIIPVYNAQKYLDECLQSCLCQDISKDDYQIICINDGSKDNSLSILYDYAERYTNIIVVDQKNSGVSAARNKGLSMAKGDYIWFVDSDDFIRQNCLKELKDLSEKDYDIISFGGYIFNSELKEEERKLLSQNKLKANKTYWGYSAFKIFKKSIADDNNILLYSEIKYGEDEVFHNDLMEYTQKIHTLEYTNYLYRKNQTSAMNSLMIPENQIKQLESVIISMVILKNGIERGKYTKDFSKKFLKERYKFVQYCFKRISVKQARKYFKLMKEQNLFSYDSKEIKKLDLPSETTLKIIYIKQHFKIWSKAFYKKSRTKTKSLLPAPIVQTIKKIFNMPD